MSIRQTAKDDMFDALSDRRRRRLLLTIRNECEGDDPRMDIEALSDAVARGVRADEVRVQLHHVHLPKLADSGYIRWDSATGTVTTGPRWDDIGAVLDVLVENRDELPDGVL